MSSIPFFSQCALFNTYIAPLLKCNNLAFLIGFFLNALDIITFIAKRHSTYGHIGTPIISTFLQRFDWWAQFVSMILFTRVLYPILQNGHEVIQSCFL